MRIKENLGGVHVATDVPDALEGVATSVMIILRPETHQDLDRAIGALGGITAFEPIDANSTFMTARGKQVTAMISVPVEIARGKEGTKMYPVLEALRGMQDQASERAGERG